MLKTIFNFLYCVGTQIIESINDCVLDNSEIKFSAVHGNGLSFKGDIKIMQLREGQKVTVTASPKTRNGKDAAYETGTARWESSDESIASVEVNPENELEATVIGEDGSGNESAVITFKADGDPDADEERELIGTLDVTVTQGEAVVFDLSVGEVTDVEEAGGGEGEGEGETEA